MQPPWKPIGVAVALGLVVVVVGIAATDSDTCRSIADPTPLILRTLSKEGYGSTAGHPNGTTVPVDVDEPLTVRASAYGCTSSATHYRWHIESVWDESYSPEASVSDDATHELTFPYPGMYRLWADHLDEDGTVLHDGSRQPALGVFSTLKVEATIAPDEASFQHRFQAFCCPGLTNITVLGTGATDWTTRLVAVEDNTLVHENHWYETKYGPQPYLDAIGDTFFETFRLEIEAVDPQMRHELLAEPADVTIQIGCDLDC